MLAEGLVLGPQKAPSCPSVPNADRTGGPEVSLELCQVEEFRVNESLASPSVGLQRPSPQEVWPGSQGRIGVLAGLLEDSRSQ